jgi:hypothetical protein
VGGVLQVSARVIGIGSFLRGDLRDFAFSEIRDPEMSLRTSTTSTVWDYFQMLVVLVLVSSCFGTSYRHARSVRMLGYSS